MRPARDAAVIAYAKSRSIVTDKRETTEPLGPSGEVFCFQAGELVDYENTVVMRQGW